MHQQKNSNLYVTFPMKKANVSLGGLLVLKQEIDLFCEYYQIKNRELFCDFESSKQYLTFYQDILGNNLKICKKIPDDAAFLWPERKLVDDNDKAYQSFKRIKYLYKLTKKKPILKWSNEQVVKAKNFLKKYSGKNFIVHLKQVGSCSTLESNANINEWLLFFQKRAKLGERNFILIGKDQISKEILQIPGIISAHDLDLSLSTQLAMMSVSDGFLGMASGLCQAAIFSEIPYVIFKHPNHHAKIMDEELDDAKSFSFSYPNQQIWRSLDSLYNIEQAFGLLNHD